MAIEQIEVLSNKKSLNDKPIIIKFNPWNYSDQNQLFAQFFKQLSQALNRKDYAKEARRAGARLLAYAKFFEPLAIASSVGAFAIICSTIIKGFGGAASAWGSLKEGDLAAVRDDLNKLLSKVSNKIIIVIDDIDRLNNSEIRQIFQLVKSLADFPNTIYLLAFDKEIVVNALQKVQEGSGVDYLEKIIQIPFEIPLIHKQEIEELLFGQLDELIEDIAENKWDKTYWGNIYHSGLKYFFNNIRDVNRYLNALRFSFEMVKNEVNPIDFLAITAIQVFAPELYYAIRDNKDIFVGLSEYKNKFDKEQSIKRYDEILARIPIDFPINEIKDFLQRIFPKIEALERNITYGYSLYDSWRRDCRICSPDLFEIYFELSLPKGEISQKEIETILSLASNSEAFAEALLKLNSDNRIIRFLERLEDYTSENIPEENIKNIISVLWNLGDVFPEGNRGFFETDTPMRILRLSYQLSKRIEDREKRFNIYKDAIEWSDKSLGIIVDQVATMDRSHGKYGLKEKPESEDKLLVNADQLLELEKLVSSKIRIWANDGRLKKHTRLVRILFMWQHWDKKELIDNFVNDMIATDEGLVDFIKGFLNKVKSYGGSDLVANEYWKISLKEIDKFLNSKEIEPRIRKIYTSSYYNNFKEKEQMAIKKFIDTFDGKTKEDY